MERDLKKLVGEMTLEEKAGMCSGYDFWHLKGVERLGIPSVMVSDGPHGLRKQDESADHLGVNESIKAVCFPAGCLTACSFDRTLVHTLGDALGREAQANELSVVLGPAVNIKRSPLCGRNFEYYSEDPYLAGEMAAAFIQGVQGHHVGTSIKHLAANNQEFNRMSCSSNVDERTLREIYLPAFETAVKKAQPYTVMCSYNRINSTFSSENPWLLTDVLRKEWGFEGYVMSDWGAVNKRVPGLKAGLELEMPPAPEFGYPTDAEIVKAVQEGSLDEAILDRAVERLLRIIFLYADNRKEQAFTMEADHELARAIAAESMVLLKNEGVLPLKQEEKLAFIGGFAERPRFQGGGSSHINCFKVESILDAMGENSGILYAKGFDADQDVYEETLAKEAIEVAKRVDKVVVFAGLPDSFECEGYDRKHMQLPACQNRLIEEILKVQKNVIVVLHNGSPVELPWLEGVKGVLEAYLGGQAVGGALAEILFGKVNPSGKLAETFPYRLEDNPSYLSFGDAVDVNYTEGIYVGYRYYDAKKKSVAFPFGHGLSYTTFSYSNLRLSRESMTKEETVSVSVDVTNTGDCFGKEVVQLYVSDKTDKVRRPLRELKGYEKVALKPGETKTVTMTVDYRSLAWYSTDLHDWYAASGTYELSVGASSRDIRLSAALQLHNSGLLPKKVTGNTTVGELLEDPRTAPILFAWKKELMSLSVPKTEEDGPASEAITNEMTVAMMFSMPLRSVCTFGACTAQELEELIKKLNRATA